MRSFSRYKVVVWDFDGVLMDSMPVRSRGFELVLASYPKQEIQELLNYHNQNGGLSRYVKFRYFFEEIRREKVSDTEVDGLASSFSGIMRAQLNNRDLLIQDSMTFVQAMHEDFRMHIASGSDENELRYLCKELDISRYFVSIHGSPKPKRRILADLLEANGYRVKDVVLVGDSTNDADAAFANAVDFVGYNNKSLQGIGVGYIDSFSDFWE